MLYSKDKTLILHTLIPLIFAQSIKGAQKGLFLPLRCTKIKGCAK